ncbi:MAG: methyltransferase domain-containing protein [Thermoflexus sp.]|uniref:class I SAM-dependent methyltransferase n=1 Tax=Thermoflexus sp. TaxID=1969742 RepID=UPI0025E20BA6|nr:methyltransferase domain-containing protein [Thermoflexus sp.]MCS6964995.1 methyltransferase domain-containing protein [Thermoflexus sp.]
MARKGGWSALLQRFFHWLYHEGSWAYDGVAAVVSGGRWVNWGMRVLDVLARPGGRVLEIGPGPGHLLQAMVERGLCPVGLDLSFAMARRARRRTGFAVPVAQGRAQALPFPDGIFDAAVTTFPAPFILEPTTWREVARVLRPGGRFVALIGAWPAGSASTHRRLWGLYRRIARSGETLPREEMFRRLAGSAGLEVQEWLARDGPWHLWGVIAFRG